MDTPPTPPTGNPPRPVIDIERSLRRLGGDRSLLRELAVFFLEDSESLMKSLGGLGSARQ